MKASRALQHASTPARIDDRSEKNIATLHRRVQPYARQLVYRAADCGITIKIISGLRTYEEQDALYEQGRTKPGKIVTHARGGYSHHNFGVAFDIGVFDDGNYVPESSDYEIVGALGRDLGLEWGGDWPSFPNQPHFQFRPDWAAHHAEDDLLAELRARNSSDQDLFG